jgi:putative NIF3 family GTP cyclohydrolase 1 type 2
MSDEWAEQMDSIRDFISANFLKRSMGLVCDFTPEIKQVYSAVFPSAKVMQKIISDDATEALLFVHHPAIWDIRQAPMVFSQMDRKLLQLFQERKIAIYNLHVPLDNFGEYSTSVNFAKALNIKPVKPFAPYFGGLAGVIGQTDCQTINELKEKFQTAVGHQVGSFIYGDQKIKNGQVAVVAGGGLDETIQEIAQEGANLFVTGISAKTAHSQKAHEFAEQHGISILGGTHYSTEKFACQAMVEYFKKLGLPCEFVEDDPVMEDM